MLCCACMTEDQFSAERHGYGRTKIVQIEAVTDKKLGEGLTGSVSRIQVESRRGKRHPFALKVIDKIGYDQEFLDRQLRIYQKMKDIPDFSSHIPFTFRKTDNGFLITDLTENDKNLVISWNDCNHKSISTIRKNRPELFANLKKINLDELEEQISEISKKLTQNDIYFAFDSLFLVIKPDGSFDTILGDLDNMMEWKGSTQVLEERNEMNKNSILEKLSSAQEISERL